MDEQWKALMEQLMETFAEPPQGEPFWVIVEDGDAPGLENYHVIKQAETQVLILYPTKELADCMLKKVKGYLPGSRTRALGHKHLNIILDSVSKGEFLAQLALAQPHQESGELESAKISIDKKTVAELRRMAAEYINLKKYGVV